MFRGFNTNGHDGNPYLKHILKRYCEMRSKGYPGELSEVKVMMQAISDEMNFQYPHNKQIPGMWMLPLLHVMNYHIRYYTKLPPLNLHKNFKEDKEIMKPNRKKYNDIFNNHGQTMSRDSREEVRTLMEEYVADFDPVLSEPGTRLFTDEGDASEPQEVVTLDDL